jgi:hypothetical protein
MTLEFRTHRLWDSYTTVHFRVALVMAALLVAPIITGARPWQENCSPAAVAGGSLTTPDAATPGTQAAESELTGSTDSSRP